MFCCTDNLLTIKSLIGYSLLHILFRNLFMRFLLLQHPPCPVLIFMRDLQMLLYHHMLLQQNLFMLKTLQSVLLRALIYNIGVMMSSVKGKDKPTEVYCVSNIHPQGPALEGVNATSGMMRKPGGTVREMSVLIF